MATIDVNTIHGFMKNLSKRRPIFHSEADFQHALARQIHKEMPGSEIRLEFKPNPKKNMSVDIWVWTQDTEIAIELKYPTAEQTVNLRYSTAKQTVRGQHAERFYLRPGTTDTPRYGFLKDIQRLEQVIQRLKRVSKARKIRGFAVLLTNQSNLWKKPQRNWKTTNDADFRLHEEREIKGNLAWAEKTSDKTKEKPLDLQGSYPMLWKNYSRFNSGKNPEFRYLIADTAKGVISRDIERLIGISVY